MSKKVKKVKEVEVVENAAEEKIKKKKRSVLEPKDSDAGKIVLVMRAAMSLAKSNEFAGTTVTLGKGSYNGLMYKWSLDRETVSPKGVKHPIGIIFTKTDEILPFAKDAQKDLEKGTYGEYTKAVVDFINKLDSYKSTGGGKGGSKHTNSAVKGLW
jgi:hypothetical protein